MARRNQSGTGAAAVVILEPYSHLPPADDHGNYWFGKRGAGNEPAIFRITAYGVTQGHYMLSLGEPGIVFEGKYFRTFPTPDEALKYLQTWYKNKSHLVG